MSRTVRVKLDDRWYTVEVGDLSKRPVRTVVDGYEALVEVSDPVEEARPSAPEGRPARARASSPPPQTQTAPTTPPARSPTARPGSGRPASGRPTGAVVSSPPNPNKVFSAPMPGVILSVAVNPGDQVVTGDVICVLEAMKMQQNLRAEWSGIIKSVLVAVGEQVMEGAPIVELE